MHDTITTLETLMDFSPVSSDQLAITNILKYIQQRLIEKGLHVERIDVHGVHSLYASTMGRKHSTVMLQGHIDVVPNGQAFRRDGDRIYGRGSYDMLFAIASYLTLIDQLDDPSHHDISLLLTSDEELGGVNGVGTIMQQPDYTADVCIIPDAGEKFGDLSIGAKGLYQLEFQLNGQAHHASRPWEGDGAADKAVRFLDELHRAFDTSSRTNSTLTIAYLDAGSILALNQGPSEAKVGVDIRYKDRAEYDRIKSIIHDLTKKFDAQIVAFQHGRSFELDIQNDYVSMFIDMYRDAIGKAPRLMIAHGSSDARYISAHGIPVVMFRPDGHGAHGDDEWLSISSWQDFHTLLTRYVTTLSRIK